MCDISLGPKAPDIYRLPKRPVSESPDLRAQSDQNQHDNGLVPHKATVPEFTTCSMGESTSGGVATGNPQKPLRPFRPFR